MCGIAGIFHLETAKPVDPERVRRMVETLVHRGPDGSGVWTAPGIGLGHRRLSIIDLAGGSQPMATEDGSLVITYNGEIYNFVEIRRELEEHGHRFRTHSDTEVILHAYRQWGEDCLRHFNGMFAFALYDRSTRSLWLARDRLGVKPLYYAPLSDGSVIFGSELKALLTHPLLRREPDLTAIEDYMALGYVPDDACLVAGVKKLGAGQHLRLIQGKAATTPQTYWKPNFADRTTARPADLADELVSLMRDAVRLRMVSDVPLGAFLSGGVDSSSVVALMSELSNQAVKTCTIGFDHAQLDETRYASHIARRFATEHRTKLVSSEDYGLLDRLVGHFDEPFADASALPTYRVCELAREGVTVALSGDGADEAFAGYRRHLFHHRGDVLRNLLPAAVRRPVFGTLGRIYPKADWAPRFLRAKTSLQELALSSAEAYARSVSFSSPELRSKLYTSEFGKRIGGHRAEHRIIAAMDNAPARDAIDRAQYADLTIWLPGDILTKTDRMSMAVSLEAREPLLDYRLVEFAGRLPAGQRIHGRSGKYLMKRAMEPYLPREILYREKMGFVTPISQWFRGALADEAAAVATESGLARTGWFDPKAMARMAADHRAGLSDHGRTLWQLLVLDRSIKRLFG